MNAQAQDPSSRRSAGSARIVALLLVLVVGCRDDGSGDERAPLVGAYLEELIEVPAGTEHGRRSSGGLAGLVGIGSIVFDPAAGVLYGYRFLTAELVRIEPRTGTVAVIGPSGNSAYLALALDPESSMLYAVDEIGDDLLELDVGSGHARVLAHLDVGAIEALAFDPDTDRLFGWSALTGELVTIDPASGATEVVGPVGNPLDGMVFDPVSQRLLGSTHAGELVEIDPATGGFQVLADVGFPVDLAVDPATGTVYGSTWYELVTVDPETGDSTDVIAYGHSDVATMTFDAAGDRLLAVVYHVNGKHADRAQLVSIDEDTGTATRLALLDRRIQALAVDWRSGVLFGVDDSSELVTIDPRTGTTVPLGLPALGNHDLAHDPRTGVFYGYLGTQLVSIDPVSGEAEPIGSPASPALDSLAFDAMNERLIAFDVNERELVAVDTVTGAVTPLFAPPFVATALALDPAGVPYAIGSGRAFELDLDAGRFSSIGEVGDFMLGLARDPVSGVLYGVGAGYFDTRLLYQIDDTGRSTFLGSLGARDVRGLAFDPLAHVLYGSDVAADELVTIDPATGAATLVGPLGFSDVEGLAFDAASSTLYGSDVATGELVRIDTTSGVGTAVLAFGFDGVYGLAMDGAGRIAAVASPTAVGGPLLSIDPVLRTVTVIAEVPRGTAGLAERAGR